MTTGFRQTNWTDAGAPNLTGQVGTLIPVLDKALGVTDLTNGWEKVFTATNIAVYRPRHGLRIYMRVDDTTTQYATIRFYETMSDASTGTNIHPTVAQAAVYTFPKSMTADSTVREYNFTATDRWFVARIRYGTFTAQGMGENDDVVFAGEPISIQASDPYCWLARMRTVAIPAVAQNLCSTISSNLGSWVNTADVWFWRNPAGTTISQGGSSFPKISAFANTNYGAAGGSFVHFPIQAASMVSTTPVVRARLPFLFTTTVCNLDTGLKSGDTYADAAGATYIAVAADQNGANNCMFAIMTSDNEVGTP